MKKVFTRFNARSVLLVPAMFVICVVGILLAFLSGASIILERGAIRVEKFGDWFASGVDKFVMGK